MKILFWNIRCLSGAGRRKQLVELCQLHGVALICLQETIKDTFTSRELNRFSRGEYYHWFWTRPKGHSGGMLMGAPHAAATICNEDKGEFFQSLTIRNVDDDFEWELINVYGPMQDDKKREFLQELVCKIHSVSLPCVVGGDFNMVRRVEDKSTGQVNN